jgi:hypothetical protein
VKNKIINAHESQNPVYFYGYESDVDQETILLVPPPYDEMYLRWMEAQIDYYNSENARYNNSIMLFNGIYDDYKRYYTRTRMPVSKGNRFIF